MIVSFFEPSEVQAAGGLSQAIRSIEAALVRTGIRVRSNPPPGELGHEGVPEIVHFHGLWQPAYLRVSARCRRSGIPYVVSPHGMLEPWAWRQKQWKKWPWFYALERHHLSGAARLIATGDVEAQNLATFFPTAVIKTLPLGLPAERGPDYVAARKTLGWGESEIVLLFLSRIHPKKGLDLLLQALARNDAARAPRARLVVVGGGEPAYLNELRDLVRREQPRLPAVSWEGEIWGEKKWAYLQGADLFCLPSHSENFGLAVLEALQVGTRVLTTNQTPWASIPSWNAGFVVNPAQDAIGAALLEFFVQPNWPLERRAALAADIHRAFSWDILGPRYRGLYDDILRSAPGNLGQGTV